VRGPGDFEIEVFDADPRRVKKLRVYRAKPPSSVSEGKRRLARPEPTPAAPPGTENLPTTVETTVGDASAPGGRH
jgi:hypothetical protein